MTNNTLFPSNMTTDFTGTSYVPTTFPSIATTDFTGTSLSSAAFPSNVTTNFIGTSYASTTFGAAVGNDDPGITALNGFRIFVCAFGVIGNLIVVSMILILAEFKKGVTHWYILQLAIADSAFLLTIPFQVVEDLNNEWIFSDGMCKAKEAVLFINYYSSIFFLTVMAFDRYIAICHAFSERMQKLRTTFAAYIITAVVWTVSILISVPVMIYSTKRGREPYCKCELQFPEPDELSIEDICTKEGMGPGTIAWDFCKSAFGEQTKACASPIGESTGSQTEEKVAVVEEGTLHLGCHYLNYTDGFKGFTYFNFIAMFLVPFVIIAMCYGLIIRKIIQTRFRGDSFQSQPKPASKDDKDRNRVVAMCATLVIVFVVCWLPFHSIHMAKMKGIVGVSTDYCIKLSYAGSIIAYLNSAINPYIYFIGARFKNQLRRVKSSKAASTIISLFSRTRADSTGTSATDPNSHTERKKTENSKMVEEAKL